MYRSIHDDDNKTTGQQQSRTGRVRSRKSAARVARILSNGGGGARKDKQRVAAARGRESVRNIITARLCAR